ncbi:acylneuraminate cytidylyltransferase [Microbacterium betulae]|uniref:N-acylneuraminate cytidylyltransferase n=1 Tax=Microbacterium betulae TaxID=2981139 RepID=A0AA97FHJ8_9MICO|nr:acylneuraminate cytidylyltransferase [Microbacterium sp. AB]WOF23318.1 acylneuraminate cytidylyltransferase [Microbacterium sp. AB]
MGEVVAVIPARGGSKGVPRKNLRRVGGLPLVARAIVAAQEASGVDRVVVSTDDAEIAGVAEEWGARAVPRPAELAGDEASSESALIHVCDVLASEGVDVGVVVLLQATSPFIVPSLLDEAIALVAEGVFDTVLSAVSTYGFLWERDASGAASAVNHDSARRPRRQDRSPQLLETGAFYAMDAAGFRAARHRFFGRVGVVEVPERTAIEIDSPEQLELAGAVAPLVRDDGGIDVDAVVTDFDGVHTDDTAIVDADGREQVRVSRSDGMGVDLLRRAGIPVLILSTERNRVVAARARKLRVDVRQGLDDKASALRAWTAERGVALSRIAYLGNDVNDLDCLEAVGWPVAVRGAHPLVTAAARVVLDRPGGAGAVRELAELVLRARRDESRSGLGSREAERKTT